ncbi:uncharacterized protein ACNLHF_006590 [Anomaloglossus baeobatrachus]
MHAAIPADERLAVTLRFLATGRSLQDLHFSSAISRSLLSVLIPETCRAIFHSLRNYIEFPKTVEEWQKIASDFEHLWQFPNCGGALDGKHVRITQPLNSGSYFYNYKGYFSIILMALVNANYEFIAVDVGMNGRVSDGGVLEHTGFGERLQNGELHLPPNSDTTANLNFVFVGDEAFPLHPNLMKPFPQKSLTAERQRFNYRLSRARRVVENAFGIMKSRFRLALKELKNMDDVVIKQSDKGGNVVVWGKDKYEVEAFRQLNDINCYTKLTTNPLRSNDEIDFLDVRVFKGNDGLLCTDIFRKKTAVNSLLSAKSSHPSQIKDLQHTAQYVTHHWNQGLCLYIILLSNGVAKAW